jgi:WD40 repeat protein
MEKERALKPVIRFSLGCLGVAALWATSLAQAPAVQTQLVRSDTYEEFAPGQLHSVSLSHLGRLSLAPELRRVYRPDAEIIWAMAVAPDGRIYVATGHSGKIFVTDAKGKGSLYLDLPAPEVTALLFHSDGKLYAGTSPDGKLFVCDPPGTATLVCETKEKYVWDLLSDPAGGIIIATGPKGKIFKANPEKKKHELLFDAPDDNVLSLARDPKGRLLAATQGKGRIYRWDQERATTPVVVFEAPDDEVRRIAVDAAGNIFAAVNSEIITRRITMPTGGEAPSPARPSEGSGGSPAPSAPEPLRAMPPPSGPAGRSEIYLIDAEGFVRSLWKPTDAPVHDIAYDAGRGVLMIAAGNKGKLLRLDVRSNYGIVLSAEEERIFALKPVGRQIYLATVGPTAIYGLGDGQARKGEYLSPALNAGTTVRWGSLRREGDGADEIEIETRSGNTKEPDGTWYDWRPVKWRDSPRDGQIQSQVARYLQWRALFKATRDNKSRELDLIEVFYIPANEPPQIRRIEVKKAAGGPPPPAPPSGMPSASMAPTASAAKEGSAGKDFQVAENSNSKKFDITWQASDPNGDPLESALYFKGEDEKNWKLIKDKLTLSRYAFEVGSIPDGAYRLKVAVTDVPANFAPNVRSDELISERFVVDNTPPVIEKIKVAASRDGGKMRWHVSMRAADSTSIIGGAKYNVDGQKWNVLAPTDGLFDELSKNFEFDTELLEGDEHVLGLVVTDREGNSAVGKAVLRP